MADGRRLDVGRRDAGTASAPALRRRDALHREHLDHVADLEVVELVEADAALEAGLDLADVVLEAAQRADLALRR